MAEVTISQLDLVTSVTSGVEWEVEVGGESKKANGNLLQDYILGTSPGIIVLTAENAVAARAVEAVTNSGILVSQGNGVAGNIQVGSDIASQAEAEAGTVENKLMNPLRVAQAIAALASSGGFTTVLEEPSPPITAANAGKDIILSANKLVLLPDDATIPIGSFYRLHSYGNGFVLSPDTGMFVHTPYSGFERLNGLFVQTGSSALVWKSSPILWQVYNYSSTSSVPYILRSGITSLTISEAIEDGDLALIFCETANQAVATPTGFSIAPNAPQSTGTAGATDATRLSVFYKILTTADRGQTIAITNPGDHLYSYGIVIKNVDPVTPFDATGGATAAASTAVAMQSVTTTRNNTLVVAAVARANDAAANQFTLGSNTALSRLDDFWDSGTVTGNGGGIAFVSGIKSAPGATGATTGTLAASSVQAKWTCAINPR